MRRDERPAVLDYAPPARGRRGLWLYVLGFLLASFFVITARSPDFFGSEWFHLLCLSVVAICAMAYPALLVMVAALGGSRRDWIWGGLWAGFGVVAALPFRRMNDLPWLPVVAAAYFAALTAAFIVWSAARALRRGSRRAETTGGTALSR